MLPRRKAARSGIRDGDGPIRSPAHLALVRGFVCTAYHSDDCEGRIEAHHVRSAATSGVGVKPGDDHAVPLCARHHREVHQLGIESFEAKHGVDLAAWAAKLAKASAHIRKAKKERGM